MDFSLFIGNVTLNSITFATVNPLLVTLSVRFTLFTVRKDRVSSEGSLEDTTMTSSSFSSFSSEIIGDTIFTHSELINGYKPGGGRSSSREPSSIGS
jgi:hypothetical protein